jgi:hypothetical protein
MLPETSLLAYFADLEDPRNEHRCDHSLINVIIIAIPCRGRAMREIMVAAWLSENNEVG